MSDLANKKAWLMQCSFPDLKGRTCVASAIVFADSDQLASEAFDKDLEIIRPEGRIIMTKPHMVVGVTVSEEALDPENVCISVMTI